MQYFVFHIQLNKVWEFSAPFIIYQDNTILYLVKRKRLLTQRQSIFNKCHRSQDTGISDNSPENVDAYL